MTGIVSQILVFCTVAVLALAPIMAIGYAIYYLVSLPLRRQERARILIDLLELQDPKNQNAAELIKAISKTKDRSLGVRFHILAGYLESGLNLGDALKRVPRLLPESIVGALSVGQALGDYRKVLPVCQTILKDAASTVRNATGNFILLLFIALPSLLVMTFFCLTVWPRFLSIQQDYQTPPVPFVSWLMGALPQFLFALALLNALLYLGALCYIGGPRLRRWIEAGIRPLSHSILIRVPWYRNRLMRNFSLMLGILLDEGVPEAEALSLAGQASANQSFKRQVDRCRRTLEQGFPLETAIMKFEHVPELSWRLRIATQQSRGFRHALTGWWEWLHVKAQQQEQNAAQTASVGLVILNGLVTALLAMSVFHLIASLIEQGTLW